MNAGGGLADVLRVLYVGHQAPQEGNAQNRVVAEVAGERRGDS